jgi:hypothetical protein
MKQINIDKIIDDTIESVLYKEGIVFNNDSIFWMEHLADKIKHEIWKEYKKHQINNLVKEF